MVLVCGDIIGNKRKLFVGHHVKSVPRLPNGTVFGYTLDQPAAAAGSLPSLVR